MSNTPTISRQNIHISIGFTNRPRVNSVLFSNARIFFLRFSFASNALEMHTSLLQQIRGKRNAKERARLTERSNRQRWSELSKHTAHFDDSSWNRYLRTARTLDGEDERAKNERGLVEEHAILPRDRSRLRRSRPFFVKYAILIKC